MTFGGSSNGQWSLTFLFNSPQKATHQISINWFLRGEKAFKKHEEQKKESEDTKNFGFWVILLRIFNYV